jgi:hypothetical protein
MKRISNLCILCREKAKQLEEMRNAKMEYKEGFWNVNSVLLGGLGHDPVLPGAKSISWSNSGEKKIIWVHMF